MLLTGGLGLRSRTSHTGWTPSEGNLGLLAGGLGARGAHNSNSPYFNTPFFDPATNPALLGDAGDPEYAFMTPEAQNPYNARAVQIFLPENLTLPSTALERLESLLRLTKPMTISLRVRSQRGPLRLEILDPMKEIL